MLFYEAIRLYKGYYELKVNKKNKEKCVLWLHVKGQGASA
jgi:hypothetical protein